MLSIRSVGTDLNDAVAERGILFNLVVHGGWYTVCGLTVDGIEGNSLQSVVLADDEWFAETPTVM